MKAVFCIRTPISLLIAIFAWPCVACASLAINEVAYAGSAASQYEEWVELFNDGDTDVDLAGWKLFKAETTTLFTLSGTIAAGGYFVACRTTGTLTAPLGGTCNAQGSFGGSGLSNTGEHLVLKDSQGVLVDEIVPIDGKWPVPNILKGESMQKAPNGWQGGPWTPGMANVKLSSDTSEQETTKSNATTAQTATDQESIEFVKRDPVYTAKLTGPAVGTAGVAVPFMVKVLQDGKKDLVSGKFDWSMGDGAAYHFDQNREVRHIFYYPGEYTVTLTYYSNTFKAEPDSIHRKKITIVPHDVVVAGSTDDGGIILENHAQKDIDLEGWSIRQGEKSFVFPAYTMAPKKGALSISSRTIGFITDQNVQLLNPSLELVSSFSGSDIDQEMASVGDETLPAKEMAPAAAASEPIVMSSSDMWKQYRWYIVAVLTAIMLILAYFGVTLYATRNEVL